MLGRPSPVWAVGARPGDQGDASAASIRTFVAPVTLLVVVAVARGPILASAGPGAQRRRAVSASRRPLADVAA